MTDPLVSVLVPVLNAERFVGAAIRSVLEARTPLEVLVQDGGSTDATVSMIRAIADDRVKIVAEPDDGQADALNRALERAAGTWILWLNGDDLVDAEAIDAVAPLLRSTSSDLVYGDFALVDKEGRQLRRYAAPRTWDRDSLLYVGLRVFSGSIFLRRSFLSDHGRFDPRWHYCMDYELLVRLAPWTRPEYAPQAIGSLRIHHAAKTRSEPWRSYREYRQVHAEYVPRRRGARLRAARSRAVVAAYLATSALRYSHAWARLRPRKAFR